MCVNYHTNSVFVPVIMLQMQAHEEEALCWCWMDQHLNMLKRMAIYNYNIITI